jgi:hypothetical protein
MTFWQWLTVLVRLTLDAVLLGIVWHHAHWSAALTLTLLMGNAEVTAIYKQVQHAKDKQERDRFRWLGRIRDMT